MDNAEKIIEMIREKEMKPKARWRFTIKNSLSWAAFIIAVLFGALAFSVILFAIQQSDFSLIAHMSHSIFEFMLGLIPLIWIIFLIVFLVIAIFSIKNSRKGYKFTSLSLAGFCTALSILTGALFFISGGAGWLENAFATNVRQYESIEERKTSVWTKPEDGYLSGTILSVGDTIFEMEDFKGKSWNIEFREADIVPSISIVDGEKIKMTGKMTSDNTFKADKILPWGGFQHRYHGGWKK
jgi:heme/copper-type cytochrome/quinol oxidase subunit 2